MYGHAHRYETGQHSKRNCALRLQGGTSKREVVGELMDSIKEELDARTLTAESIDILKVHTCIL